MDKHYFLLFLALLLIIAILLQQSYSENFPYGSYTRSNTLGRLLPRARDRDTNPAFQVNGDNSRENEEANDKEVQHIYLDETSGNYVWNTYLNFPYGGYIYNSSYPVYLAKDICPDEKPYYNTLNGQCIFIDIKIIKNTPSGEPDKIFNSDLPGYRYETTPSVNFTLT